MRLRNLLESAVKSNRNLHQVHLSNTSKQFTNIIQNEQTTEMSKTEKQQTYSSTFKTLCGTCGGGTGALYGVETHRTIKHPVGQE
jgi:hypothetical protein